MTLDMVELEASARHQSGDIVLAAAYKTMKLCLTVITFTKSKS